MKWIIPILFLSAAAWAKTEPKRSACNEKDLVRQDCRLRDGVYNLRLLSDTVAWYDGTWHTVEEIPLKGKQSAWDKMRFEVVNGWPLLQLWIWDQGAAPGEVQSLHWLTVSLLKRKFVILAEGVVRKRRPKAEAPADKPEFLFDGWQTHALKPQKNGDLEWTLGSEKKIIKRTEHGL